MMKRDIRKEIYRSGFIGTAIIVLGSLVTALAYEGRAGEPYSFLNHFISELGEVGVSELAGVFNVSLFASGVCVVVFMAGLGFYLGGRFAYLVSAVGVVCGVAAALVGVFPMNTLGLHALSALTFFLSGLVTAALFTVYVLVRGRDKLSRWLALPSAVSTVAFAAFLWLPARLSPADQQFWVHLTNDAVAFERPDVWLAPILEWAVLAAVIVWITSVAWYLRGQVVAASQN